MFAAGLFDVFATPLAWFYGITNDYILSITAMALIVMLITAPLVLKSTKGMLEMQKLAPQMKRLQNEHRGDRQKLNEEMMKLYQEHKVNPLASCFPLLLQMPVFIIMFKVLHGLTRSVTCTAENTALDACRGVAAGAKVFNPDYVSTSSELFKSLKGKTEMLAWGLDLSKTPLHMMSESFGKGLIYALIVVVLGALYFIQQKMVAARAAAAPNMSETQQKIMQYLPVVFAVFLVFYLTGLVIYYMAQAIFRIALQAYITRRFYRGEHSLGRQAQAAGDQAREIAKKDGNGGGGLFAQAKREMSAAKTPQKPASSSATVSKRVTPPKNRPTPSGRAGRPAPSGKVARPGATPRPTKKK
jgi:YidC/Oxa1 family membrane protein insertase